ncbi:hypothetical protein [Mesorhizobium sp. URHB0026]
MRLLDRLVRRKGRGFHSALATSFAVEFGAFEDVMLPQLMGSGATNILIVADDRMTALALMDGSTLPRQLGRDYALYGPPVRAGVFHPKIVLQLGRDGGRAFVSSANITGAGLGGNLEIATEIECSAEPGPEQDFIRAVWHYVERITSETEGAARDALDWARERTPWIAGPVPEDVQVLGDDSLLAFLAIPDELGVLERFAGLVGGAPVERLIIVSPYWDKALDAIADIRAALNPGRITVLLDAQRHDFPRDAEHAADLEIIDISEWEGSRFTHAKLLIAMTAGHDHVLSGSANCTPPALGRKGFAGTNAEACVYRRLPAGISIETLELLEFLDLPATPASELPVVEHREPISFTPLAGRRAGSFEVDHGLLIWTPPDVPRWTGGSIELIDSSGDPVIRVEAERLIARSHQRIVPLDDPLLAKVHFARVVEGEISSTVVPVVHRALMRNRRREPASGRVARSAAAFLEGSGAEFFLLEAFEYLYRADTAEADAAPEVGAAHGPRPRKETLAEPGRKLSYEEFMADRAGRPSRGAKGENALAGTHCDGVRVLLNRLSGGGEAADDRTEDVDDDNWMDLGDESGDSESLNPRIPEPDPGSRVEVDQKPPAADRKAFERAVDNYVEGLTNDERSLSPADVVKLRLLLMVILWNAYCVAFPGGLQCSVDDKGWPRLVLRVIAAFFCGRNPPIRRLILASDLQEMPIDFLECWATVIWALDTIARMLPVASGTRDFLSRLPKLKAQIVTQLGLTQADLAGDVMTRWVVGLSREMGQRLGIEVRQSGRYP